MEPNPESPFISGYVLPPIQAFTIHAKPTLQEGTEILNLVVSRSARWMINIVALAVFYLVLSGIGISLYPRLIGFAIMVVFFFRFPAHHKRQLFNKGQGIFAPKVFEFDPSGVRVATGMHELSWKWEAFVEFRFTPKFLILDLLDGQHLVVARSWCADDAKWSKLEQFLSCRLRAADAPLPLWQAEKIRAERLSAERHLKLSTLGMTAIERST